MDAQIIAVFTPDHVKELLAAVNTQTDTTTNNFCHCCFTKEGNLHSYALKTFALMHAFEVQFLTLCYICKEVAQQAEKFIAKVQNNQSFLTVNDNSESKVPEYDPFLRLEKYNLEKFDTNATGFHIDGPQTEVKSEVDELSDSNDSQTQNEQTSNDQTPNEQTPNEQTLNEQTQTNIADNAAQVLHEEKIISDDENDGVDKAKETVAKIKKILAEKIKKYTITKEQCMKEREEKAKHPDFLSAKHKCTLCIKTMTSWIRLSKHVDAFHTLECGPFQCDICKRRKLTSVGLYNHELSHYLRYKCLDCGMITSYADGAKTHYIKEHTDDKSSSKYHPRGSKAQKRRSEKHREMCKYCHTYPRRMSVHLKCCRRREEEKKKKLMRRMNPFYCAVCNRSFANHLCFTRHSRGFRHLQKLKKDKQSKDKFICDLCGKQYNVKGFLRNHIFSVHLKMYKLPCKYCPRKFFCAKALKRHTAEKHELSCGFCEENFYSKESLDEHRLKQHRKEKPFACNVCDIDFVEYKFLFEHDNTVHRKSGEIPPEVQEIVSLT